jgi:hypothetical protein
MSRTEKWGEDLGEMISATQVHHESRGEKAVYIRNLTFFLFEPSRRRPSRSPEPATSYSFNYVYSTCRKEEHREKERRQTYQTNSRRQHSTYVLWMSDDSTSPFTDFPVAYTSRSSSGSHD